MAKIKVSFTCAALALVVGCTGSTNPEDASLFDNINNLNSGEYDNQIKSNEAQAQAILRNNKAAEGRISNLKSQSAANSRAIAGLKNQAAATRKSAAVARARVSGNPAKTAQLKSLEAQLVAVSSDINSGQASQKATSVELSKIKSAIDSL